MSALGQKRTFTHLWPMSALPPKADIGTQSWNVRFVPKADIKRFPWGMPACQAWYEEATLFESATVSEPASKPQPLTLKNFCLMGHLAAKSGIFIAGTCDWWCSFAFAA